MTNGVSFTPVDGACLLLRITTTSGYKSQFTISTLNVNSTGAYNVSYEYCLYNANRTGNNYKQAWPYNIVGFANSTYFGIPTVMNYPDYNDSGS